MTREQYEQRKQKLDEQLEAGIELLRTAHRQQVRALDLVWMTTAEEDLGFLQLPAAASSQDARPSPQASPPVPRRTASQLFRDLMVILPRLPEVFDRNDVCEALGHKPDRGSLYRAVQNLLSEKLIALEAYGSGRVPSRYRKLGASTSPAEA